MIFSLENPLLWIIGFNVIGTGISVLAGLAGYTISLSTSLFGGSGAAFMSGLGEVLGGGALFSGMFPGQRATPV